MNNSSRKKLFWNFFSPWLQYFIPWPMILLLLLASFVPLLFFTKAQIIKFVCVKTFADLVFEFCPNKKVGDEVSNNLKELGKIMSTLEYYFSKFDSTVRIDKRDPPRTRILTCKTYWRSGREIEKTESDTIDKIKINVPQSDWIGRNQNDINGELVKVYGFYAELVDLLKQLSKRIVEHESQQSEESKEARDKMDREVCEFLVGGFNLAGEIELLIATLIDLGREWGYSDLTDPRDAWEERRGCEFTNVLDRLNALMEHRKYFESNGNCERIDEGDENACYQRVTLSNAQDALPYCPDLWGNWPYRHTHLRGMLWAQGVESLQTLVFDNRATSTGPTVEKVLHELDKSTRGFENLSRVAKDYLTPSRSRLPRALEQLPGILWELNMEAELLSMDAMIYRAHPPTRLLQLLEESMLEATRYLEEISGNSQRLQDDDIRDINYLSQGLCRFYANYPEDELQQLYDSLKGAGNKLGFDHLSCRDKMRCSDFLDPATLHVCRP